MSYLVDNCFHWIGYHITDYLLEQGEKVVGVGEVKSELEEQLSMLIGRNSLFTHLQPLDDATYHTAIIIGESTFSNVSERQLHIQTAHKQKNDQHITILSAPYLYGEWMPMYKDGCYTEKKEKVPFDSEQFLQEAVHISDFARELYSLMKKWERDKIVELPKTIHFTKKKHVKHDTSVEIQNNRPVKAAFNQLQEHYRRFTFFYRQAYSAFNTDE